MIEGRIKNIINGDTKDATLNNKQIKNDNNPNVGVVGNANRSVMHDSNIKSEFNDNDDPNQFSSRVIRMSFTNLHAHLLSRFRALPPYHTHYSTDQLRHDKNYEYVGNSGNHSHSYLGSTDDAAAGDFTDLHYDRTDNKREEIDDSRSHFLGHVSEEANKSMNSNFSPQVGSPDEGLAHDSASTSKKSADTFFKKVKEKNVNLVSTSSSYDRIRLDTQNYRGSKEGQDKDEVKGKNRNDSVIESHPVNSWEGNGEISADNIPLNKYYGSKLMSSVDRLGNSSNITTSWTSGKNTKLQEDHDDHLTRNKNEPIERINTRFYKQISPESNQIQGKNWVTNFETSTPPPSPSPNTYRLRKKSKIEISINIGRVEVKTNTMKTIAPPTNNQASSPANERLRNDSLQYAKRSSSPSFIHPKMSIADYKRMKEAGRI